MIETVVRTEDVPRAERFDYWCDTVCPLLLASTLRSDHAADFRARMYGLDLGGIRAAEAAGPTLQLHRSAKLIRRGDPEAHQLWLTVSGHVGVSQGGREASAGAGDMVLYDSSRPFHSSAVAPRDGVASGVVLVFSKTLFPIRPEALDRLMTTRLPTDTGIGAVLARYLTELVRSPARYTPADAVRMATVTMDLVAAWCAHELEAGDTLPPETHQRALQTRIHHFILTRLGDPDLSPATVAAAHQISPRYLHKLFQGQGATVAEWIRRARLERCRRDLADPAQRGRPVHAVAARWGYTDAAHFSRTFRTAYGMSPTEFRRTVGPVGDAD